MKTSIITIIDLIKYSNPNLLPDFTNKAWSSLKENTPEDISSIPNLAINYFIAPNLDLSL